MTPAEIKAKSEAHKERIAELRGEIEAECARWRVLEVICKHPNSYKTSCMGDSGWHCPDCGKTR